MSGQPKRRNRASSRTRRLPGANGKPTAGKGAAGSGGGGANGATSTQAGAPTNAAEAEFWFGKAGGALEDRLADGVPVVRVSGDAAASVRSLGTPPVASRVNNPDDHAALIQHTFESIYQRASAMATALGHAAGIIDEAGDTDDGDETDETADTASTAGTDQPGEAYGELGIQP